jgi:hypothetical protein
VQQINLMLLWVLQSQHLHACCIHVCPYLPVRSPSPHTCLPRGLVFPRGNHVSQIKYRLLRGTKFRKLQLHGDLSFGQHLAYRILPHLLHVTAFWTLQLLDSSNSSEWCPQCTLLVMTLHTTALCFLLIPSRHSYVFRHKSNP